MTWYEFHVKIIASGWKHIEDRGLYRHYSKPGRENQSFPYYMNYPDRKIARDALKAFKKNFGI